MDANFVGALTVSWILGWISKDYFTPKVEAPPCKCECACVNKVTESSGGVSSWLIWIGLIAFLVVVAANAAIALKVTVISRGEVKEVGLSVKGKSKGVYNPTRGFQLTG